MYAYPIQRKKTADRIFMFGIKQHGSQNRFPLLLPHQPYRYSTGAGVQL